MQYQYNLGIAFYEVSRNHAEKVALKYPDEHTVRYAELNELSNQLAHYLLQSGLTKGDVIAIFNEKSFLFYALMLACLKTGIIYTNLDVSSPWPRAEKIIGTCIPRGIFFDHGTGNLYEACKHSFPSISLYPINELYAEISTSSFGKNDLNESFRIHGSDAAYIMFTSGSTGFPKGAVMSHNNLLNFIQWGRQTFSIRPDDVFTNANPIYFDNSVFDFYTSLFNGAMLVPLSHELVKDARQLVKAINESKCTIWFSVPSLLVYLLTTKALSKDDFKDVRRISFGGEGFPKNKLKQLFDLFGGRMTLFNVYGPTECTCICSSYIINPADFDNMNELAPLGNIAPNFGYEILPIDPGNKNFGELALTGPCVGLGYFNDPDRTAQAFVQNPNKSFSQVMYKTGDMVEKAENGYLYFKGRIDNQVKHMGYRIELEEVEAAFSSLPYINEVGVIYEKINAELGQIKAFITINENNKDSASILGDIRNLLPPYMIPRILKILTILPKNANGKIDRKQLANL